MNIIKLGVMNILQLKKFYPADGEHFGADVLKELISSQQELMKTQFEIEDMNEGQLKTLIVNCKKFNQMMSSISIAQLLERDIVKNWCNYTAKKTFGLLNQQQILEFIKPEQMSILLQLPLESLKQLNNLKDQWNTEDLIIDQIAVSNSLLGLNLELLQNALVQANQEFHVQAFSGLIHTLQAISGQIFLKDLQRFSQIEDEILRVIRTASKPYVYSDQISTEYFNSLLSFIGQNTEAFLSKIGIEFVKQYFLHHYSCASENAQSISGRIITATKKLLHFQKTRDATIPDDLTMSAMGLDTSAPPSRRKGIFYGYMLNCLVNHASDNENTLAQEKNTLLALLHTTQSDL